MAALSGYADLCETSIAILRDRPKVRVWVPRCGAGAEAYEWAAILRAHVAGLIVFATDAQVHGCCTGLFSDAEVAPMPEARRRAVLDRAADGWEAPPRLRHHIIRADHVLLSDAPLGKMDLVSLHNAQITAEEWPAMLRTVQRAMRTGGLLFVGDAEVPALTDGFSVVGPGLLQRLGPVSEPAGQIAPPPLPGDAALLALLAPPTLIVDAHDRVLRRLGAVGAFLIAPDAAWPRPLAEAVAPPIAAAAADLLRAVRQGKAVMSRVSGGVRLTARRAGDALVALSFDAQDSTAALTAQNARLAAINADLRARLAAATGDPTA